MERVSKRDIIEEERQNQPMNEEEKEQNQEQMVVPEPYKPPFINPPRGKAIGKPSGMVKQKILKDDGL